MNEIIDIKPYSEKTVRVRIENRLVASKALPGNFVIVKFSKTGQRIPFSIVSTDVEQGILDIIIHRAAGLDNTVDTLHIGDVLPDLLGPLGVPAVIAKDKNILFFGDGAGIVPLLPIINAHRDAGCRISAIVTEQSSRVQCMFSEISDATDYIVLSSDEEMVPTAIDYIRSNHIDKVYMSGPTLMMKKLAAETQKLGVDADCLLNMLMIDGIGLCGVCRVMVDGKRKQTCVDGPIFNAHLVDFDQMLNRQRLFE